MFSLEKIPFTGQNWESVQSQQTLVTLLSLSDWLLKCRFCGEQILELVQSCAEFGKFLSFQYFYSGYGLSVEKFPKTFFRGLRKPLLVKRYTGNTYSLAELIQIASRYTFSLLKSHNEFQTSYQDHQLYRQFANPNLKDSSSTSSQGSFLRRSHTFRASLPHCNHYYLKHVSSLDDCQNNLTCLTFYIYK